jgi:hypothetical protein
VTERNARIASDLYRAVAELPHVRRALTDKHGRYHEGIHLEMSAAEMAGGRGQGSNHHFTVPPSVARKILDAAGRIMRAEIDRINNATGPQRRTAAAPKATRTAKKRTPAAAGRKRASLAAARPDSG